MILRHFPQAHSIILFLFIFSRTKYSIYNRDKRPAMQNQISVCSGNKVEYEFTHVEIHAERTLPGARIEPNFGGTFYNCGHTCNSTRSFLPPACPLPQASTFIWPVSYEDSRVTPWSWVSSSTGIDTWIPLGTRVGIFRDTRANSLSEDNKFAIFCLVADMYLSTSANSAPGFAYPNFFS